MLTPLPVCGSFRRSARSRTSREEGWSFIAVWTVPRQLGYERPKCLKRLTATDDLKKVGREFSDPSPEYAWYAGI
jgi:hypothetical protein